MKFYSYKKGGGGTSFSHAEGGMGDFWDSFYVVACVVLVTLMGGGYTKSFNPLKKRGGGREVVHSFDGGGGGAKGFGPDIFPLCSPPPPPPRN